jgi:hypothetical protein
MTDARSDTRIFSPLAVAGLCDTIGRYWYLFKRLTAVPAGDTIGRYWYLFKRLTAVPAGRFHRFEHSGR